jgi:hypothetical protein
LVTAGEPVWRHRDAVRFWESNAGAGPRATPTLSNGRAYTFGATGILNALDAGDGTLVWSRNVASDTDTKVPGWGFASSPLVVEDVVIVAAAGKLVACDIATGKPRWSGPARGGSYSSPHLLTIGGVAQVLLLNNAGVTSVTPANGTLLWEHAWQGVTILQPALTADGDVLISTGGASVGIGMRRLAVAHGPGGWTVSECWTSRGLKPYFNDLVVHKNHAFGFDGSILACIDLAHGERNWKGGRYGVIRCRFLDPDSSPEVIAQKIRQQSHAISQRSVERIIADYGLQKKLYALNPANPPQFVQAQRTRKKQRSMPADPKSLERQVRQVLADKISGNQVGIWLLLPEHLRLGTWDLMRSWTGAPTEQVQPCLALHLVNEAALCLCSCRQRRTLSQKGFELANGLPFVPTDPAIHDLLDRHTIQDAQQTQIALGELRRAGGHFTGTLLALDPHRMTSYSKRQVAPTPLQFRGETGPNGSDLLPAGLPHSPVAPTVGVAIHPMRRHSSGPPSL